MRVVIKDSEREMAVLASKQAIDIINQAIARKGEASIVLATGTSQDVFLDELTKTDEIDWRKVEVFHLDEYLGISEEHPASFRRYLREHFLEVVGEVKDYYLIQGDAANSDEESKRISTIIASKDIDLACVGIGENGHLAFNDPPADFETDIPYIIVELDQRGRQQQVNEGHFPSLEKVPQYAISISVQQVMKSSNIICFVPDQRKAEAVRNCLEGEVSQWHPASILQDHKATYTYLDQASSSLLQKG